MRLLLLYYFLWPWHPSAQNDDQVSKTLFINQSLTWQKSYNGLWDDALPVHIDLAADGEKCKGYLYFGDMKNKYVLTGIMNNAEIKLEEQDLNANITGRLVLRINDKNAQGTWYNANKSFNAHLDLKESKDPVTVNYWIKSYAPKDKETESSILLQKDFADEINTKFYYKPINKTLSGTSILRDEENFNHESNLEDYLHHQAGRLSLWKQTDKKLEINYKLGNSEYSENMDLVAQVPMVHETFADHWIAVDINYPKIEKPELNEFFTSLIGSFLEVIQNKKKNFIDEKEDGQNDRLIYRMSIWPQVDILNANYLAGMLKVKDSWDENQISIPFYFDLKKGEVINSDDLWSDPRALADVKKLIVQPRLDKLKSGSSLDYRNLSIDDFKLITVRNEGISFSAPFDVVYGYRQIIVPFNEIKGKLNSKYFSN